MNGILNSMWNEDTFNAVNILMGCPIMAAHDGELGGTGQADGEPEGEPRPQIKPPLPQEIPAPQAPQPEISPFQAPPPADPGMPEPEA